MSNSEPTATVEKPAISGQLQLELRLSDTVKFESLAQQLLTEIRNGDDGRNAIQQISTLLLQNNYPHSKVTEVVKHIFKQSDSNEPSIS